MGVGSTNPLIVLLLLCSMASCGEVLFESSSLRQTWRWPRIERFELTVDGVRCCKGMTNSVVLFGRQYRANPAIGETVVIQTSRGRLIARVLAVHVGYQMLDECCFTSRLELELGGISPRAVQPGDTITGAFRIVY